MNDKDILRSLATEIAEVAHLPIQDENRKLHCAINSLRMIRPVVLLDELPWNQLNADGELTLRCEDPFLRDVEQKLRRTLYRWHHCAGDMIVDPFYRLKRVIHIGDIGVTISEQTLSADEGNHIIAHQYTDQLATLESLEKLHDPEILIDDALTAARFERLSEIFGDVLPIRIEGITEAGYYVPWDNISMWRGVEPIYIDLYDDPDLLHALMQKILAIRLRLLDRLETLDLLDDNWETLHCTPALVDDLPLCPPNAPITRKNIWGRGAAQLFASVSPAMHDEFEITYAKQFFQGFGLVYYGCCEPLHDKIDIVEQLPNLRKLSITPWADVRKSAERINGRYVLSRKPNPAAVAVSALDETHLRNDILETLTLCRAHNTPVEFILKDISSVNHNPHNLTRWSEVVTQTIRNF